LAAIRNVRKICPTKHDQVYGTVNVALSRPSKLVFNIFLLGIGWTYYTTQCVKPQNDSKTNFKGLFISVIFAYEYFMSYNVCPLFYFPILLLSLQLSLFHTNGQLAPLFGLFITFFLHFITYFYSIHWFIII